MEEKEVVSFSENQNVVDIFNSLISLSSGNAEIEKQLNQICNDSTSYEFFLTILFAEGNHKKLNLAKQYSVIFLVKICQKYQYLKSQLFRIITNFISENISRLSQESDSISKSYGKLFSEIARDDHKSMSSFIISLLDNQPFAFRFIFDLSKTYIEITRSVEYFDPIITKAFQPLIYNDSELLYMITSVDFINSASKVIEKMQANENLQQTKIDQSKKCLIQNFMVLTAQNIFNIARTLPEKHTQDFLLVLDDVIKYNSSLFDDQYEYFLFQIIEQIVAILPTNAIPIAAYYPYAQLSETISKVEAVQKSTLNFDLISNWFNVLSVTAKKCFVQENISIYPHTVECLALALSQFSKFEIFQTDFEQEIHKNIAELSDILFVSLTQESKPGMLLHCLEQLYENGTPSLLFSNLAAMLEINSEQTVPQLIEIANSLAENKNPSIGPIIEICANLLVSHDSISPLASFEKYQAIIDAITSICLRLDPLNAEEYEDIDNNPKIWLEIAFAHFLKKFTKAYLSQHIINIIEEYIKENPQVIVTFLARILFDLSQPNVSQLEIFTLVEAVKVDLYPQTIIAAIQSNEIIVNAVTQCRFPFTDKPEFNAQSRALYNILLQIANICENEEMLQAILNSNVERFEDGQLVERTIDCILGFFQSPKSDLTAVYQFLFEFLFPRLEEMAKTKTYKLTVTNFILQYARVICDASKRIPLLSEAAITHMNAFLSVITACISNINGNEEFSPDEISEIFSTIITAINVFLKWKCINIGVLAYYEKFEPLDLIALTFQEISQVPQELLLNEYNFIYDIIEFIVRVFDIFTEIQYDHPDYIPMKAFSVSYSIKFIGYLTAPSDLFNKLCESLENQILTPDFIQSEEELVHELLIQCASFCANQINTEKALPTVFRKLVLFLLTCDKERWESFVGENVSLLADEEEKDRVIETFSSLTKDFLFDLTKWDLLMQSFFSIESSIKDAF